MIFLRVVDAVARPLSTRKSIFSFFAERAMHKVLDVRPLIACIHMHMPSLFWPGMHGTVVRFFRRSCDSGGRVKPRFTRAQRCSRVLMEYRCPQEDHVVSQPFSCTAGGAYLRRDLSCLVILYPPAPGERWLTQTPWCEFLSALVLASDRVGGRGVRLLFASRSPNVCKMVTIAVSYLDVLPCLRG